MPVQRLPSRATPKAIFQDGGEFATVSQSGNGADALVDQRGTGTGNKADVTQKGDVTATVLQLGGSNLASVNRLNNAFATANITQSGIGGVATINQ